MNKLFFLVFFVSQFYFSQSTEIDASYKKMIEEFYDGFETILPQEADKLIGNENVYFLDAREKKEYNVSHIKNSIYLGYDKIDWSKLNKIPKNATIIVYCSVGARSQTIGKKIKEKGYKQVKNLYGGLFLWANQERAMFDSKNKLTTKIHGFDKNWGKWIKKGQVIY